MIKKIHVLKAFAKVGSIKMLDLISSLDFSQSNNHFKM